MKKILIATHPFACTGIKPRELLVASGCELMANPYGRRLRSGEVQDHLRGVDAVIAGTEPYNAETLSQADKLKVISRVGIGLDNVDLKYCRDRGIAVTYTPDAPTQAVAELTVANMLNLIRHIHQSDRSVREHAWNRLMGFLVREVTIGIIGVGRIGGTVVRLLESFKPKILAYDIDDKVTKVELPNVHWVPLNNLLANSDIVTLHIPMNDMNRYFMCREKISLMKTGAAVINTSRGGVLDTEALTDALLQRHLGGAALDVFEQEPYEGPLTRMDNVILTAHMGASANESRYLMELGAVEDCLRVLRGESPSNDALAV